MLSLKRTIDRYRRRLLLNRVLRGLGMGLLTGLLAAAILLVTDRLSPGWEMGPLLAAPVVAGGLIGIVWALLTDAGRLESAVDLDRALHLRDRLGTAVALEAPHVDDRWRATTDDAFAGMVRRDAEQLADRIDVRAAAPLQIGGVWALVAVATAGLLAMTALLPERAADPAAVAAAEEREEAAEAQARVVNTIEATVDQLKQTPDLPPAAEEQLQALDELAAQMKQTDADADALADESAAVLEDLADTLAEQSQRDLTAADQLARRFQGPETNQPPMSMEQFDQALARGDFGAAAEQLEQLLDRAETMDPAAAEEAADHLRDLGRRLQESAAEDQPGLEESAARLEQALRDQGIDEQAIERMLDGGEDPQEATDALRERGADPQVAEDLARDLDELAEARRQQTQQDQDARSVGDALEEAAETLDRREEAPEPAPGAPPPKPEQPDPAPTDPSSPPTEAPSAQDKPGETPPETGERSGDKTPGETGEPTPTPTPDERQAQSNQSADAPAEERPADAGEQSGDKTSGETSEPKPGEPQPAQPTDTPSAQRPGDAGEQSGDETSGATSEPKPGEPRPAQPADTPSAQCADDDGEQSGVESPGEEQPGQSDQPVGTPSEQGQPAASPAGENPSEQASGASSPTDQNDGAAPASQAPDPAQALRELARRQEQARRNQQTARDLRRSAGEMIDGAGERPPSGDQPSQADRPGTGPDVADSGGPKAGRVAGGSEQGDNGAPRFDQTTDLDLAGDENATRTLAEWLSDQEPAPPGTEGPGTEGPGPRRQRISRAQEIAERAVNQSVVPPRYHRIIKDYFKRLPATAERAIPPPPTSGGSEG